MCVIDKITYFMRKIFPNALPGLLMVILAMLIFSPACNDDGNNIPLPFVNITIDPNSTIYQELNVVGGWRYLDESDGVLPPSRGLIVYRLSTMEFMAYDRIPPYKPDSCCLTSTNCTKLMVGNNYPFVVDTCTDSKYLIIDGSPSSGPSNQFLLTYIAEYDGITLYIHN